VSVSGRTSAFGVLGRCNLQSASLLSFAFGFAFPSASAGIWAFDDDGRTTLPNPFRLSSRFPGFAA
jgi:hypothetical protein